MRSALGLLAALSVSLTIACGGPRSNGETSATPSGGGDSTPRVDVLFTYGSEKQTWIEEATATFNRGRHKTAGGKVIHVEAVPMGSGECVDEILTRQRQPHIISPASAAFIKLGNAESRGKTGRDLVGDTRNLVLSPVVIAMWQTMAQAIGWGSRPIGWRDVVDLARQPEGWAAHGHPEWGR